jgi:hypothetical protein
MLTHFLNYHYDDNLILPALVYFQFDRIPFSIWSLKVTNLVHLCSLDLKYNTHSRRSIYFLSSLFCTIIQA